ncbi:hypothetical protein NPIL_539041 [Nephila pilipes]|uniref:Uncharacterized protein n=1 Tax=Nephila pilipes TaxID=299642 RepID=A0A8X6NZT6_NEPPI|nr:hypothetical protein NPIL_539041 [Nephila pilipes]
MKRMSSSMIVSSKRVFFNYDTKEDSSFSDDAVPLHHFHLGQDIYAAVTYFANVVQIHLRQYRRDENNRLFPTKRGMLQEMKRKSSSIDVSSERVCFNDDDDDTKVDSSFSDDAVPLHHFHLGQDIYAAVTYFANAVQIHLRQYGRNDNNRLFPTKRGVSYSFSKIR